MSVAEVGADFVVDDAFTLDLAVFIIFDNCRLWDVILEKQLIYFL